jgi:rifampicin phosphotransferase
MVLPLDDALDVQSVGEKAFRLAEMRRIGLPVPNAMVITNSAFQLLLSSGNLQHAIEAKLSMLTADTPQVISDLADDIEALVASSDIPMELIESLTKLVAPLLALGPVVVRSSACGEDSATAAFAGQLDSFLGVRTRDEVLHALKRCWASYWSHRSLAYQRARHVRLRGMGVIVQSQVDAKFAGVLFTRDVQNAQSEQMVAEYCEGLADGLVAGSITPRRLIISWYRRADETSDDHDTAGSAGLSAKSVANLAELGQTVEKVFGCPQDIEWAVDQEDNLRIVQSRPITAFVTNSDRVIWSNANVNENFPEPVCPLLYSIASLGYYHYFRNLGIAFGIRLDRIAEMEYPLRNIIGVHGGRIYYNLTNIHAVLRAAPWGEFLAESFNQFVGANATTATNGARPRGRLLEWRETLRIIRRAWGCFSTMEQRITRFELTIDAFAEDCHPERLSENRGPNC